jgi:hypothetical protein
MLGKHRSMWRYATQTGALNETRVWRVQKGHKRGAVPHEAGAGAPRHRRAPLRTHPGANFRPAAQTEDRAGGYLMIVQYVGKLDGRLVYGSGFTLKG